MSGDDLELERLRKVALATKRLHRLQMSEAFDGEDLTSRPTPTQVAAFKALADKTTVVVTGGNQCLAEGTLVATPQGPVAIEDIRPGDTVYDEHGKPIKVLRTFNNGPKEVADITQRGVSWATCTSDHVWLVENSSKPRRGRYEQSAKEFRRDEGIVRQELDCPMGNVEVLDAYALGALLGDGCSRQKGPMIYISSAEPELVAKVANLSGGTARKNGGNNYTWSLGHAKVSYYDEWCRGRYAHEKVVDLDVVKTWSRKSLVAFMAGLLDTDGSVTASNGGLSISFSMQSQRTIAVIKWIALALWQVPLSVHVDGRDKYKNGFVFEAYCRSSRHVKRILRELDPHIISPQKKYKPEYSMIDSKRVRESAVAATWGANRRVINTYDIHVDSPTNLYCLANGMVTHNSGKSAWACRNVSWFFNRDHKYVDIEGRWKDKPMMILVISQNSGQYEDLYEKKIKPLLPEDEVHETRVGGILKTVRHRGNKSKILFYSYENAQECTKRIQSFRAHLVVIDEICTYLPLYEEAHRRVQRYKGVVITAFTQKVAAPHVRRYLDTPTPYKANFVFNAFDNPSYDDEAKARIMADLNALPIEIRQKKINEILYGIYSGDEHYVYNYSPVLHCANLPAHYDARSWRHAEAVDPAASGRTGYMVAAQDPQSHIWYIVKAKYLQGQAPTDLVDAIKKEGAPYNIIHRVCDPNATWFHLQAIKDRMYYVILKKDDRKTELIKGVSQALLDGTWKLTPGLEHLEAELGEAKWTEDHTKIRNSTKYHLLDAFQYLVDTVPAAPTTPHDVHPHVLLALANERRKQAEARATSRPRQQRFVVGGPPPAFAKLRRRKR